MMHVNYKKHSWKNKEEGTMAERALFFDDEMCRQNSIKCI